jgi:hypothetical protein
MTAGFSAALRAGSVHVRPRGVIAGEATLAWRATDTLKVYFDAGRGYHSNDARGTTDTVAHETGLPVTRVNLIAPALGAETGVRFEQNGFSTMLTAFYLHLDSELTYTGDAVDTGKSLCQRAIGHRTVVQLAAYRPHRSRSVGRVHQSVLSRQPAGRQPDTQRHRVYVFRGHLGTHP